jgi:hypothetical protein
MDVESKLALWVEEYTVGGWVTDDHISSSPLSLSLWSALSIDKGKSQEWVGGRGEWRSIEIQARASNS